MYCCGSGLVEAELVAKQLYSLLWGKRAQFQAGRIARQHGTRVNVMTRSGTVAGPEPTGVGRCT